MKVTGRLLLPALDFPPGDFVEMRLFHLSSQSRTAAVLFAFFEAITAPQFAALLNRLRRMLKERLKGDDYFIPKLFMEYLLEPSMTEEDKLALWNHDMTFDSVLTVVRKLVVDAGEEPQHTESTPNPDILAQFCDSFGCKLCDGDNEEPGMRINVTVRTVLGAEAVLYRKYARSSFVLLPCRHIAHKYALFDKVRRKIGDAAVSKADITGRCQCEVHGCNTDISSYIFNLANDTAAFDISERSNTVVNSLLRSPRVSKFVSKGPPQCSFCRSETNGVKWCAKSCFVCEKCYVASVFSESRLTCPLCGLPTQSDKVLNVVYGTANIAGVVTHPHFSHECITCQNMLGMESFSGHLAINHGCSVCNSCVKAENEHKGSEQIWCPNCKRDYLKKERIVLVEKEILEDCPELALIDSPEKEAVRSDFPQNQTGIVMRPMILVEEKKASLFAVDAPEDLVPPSAHQYDFDQPDPPSDPLPEAKFVCYCGETIIPSGPVVTLACHCYCQKCSFSASLSTGEPWCHQCGKEYTKCRTEVCCTACGKHLESNGNDWQKLAGLCKCGSILCVYCVKLTRNHAKQCVICGEIVSNGLEANRVKFYQEENLLGCYCELPDHMTESLKCGHKVHQKCAKELHACRICGTVVNEGNKREWKRLAEYFTTEQS